MVECWVAVSLGSAHTHLDIQLGEKVESSVGFSERTFHVYDAPKHSNLYNMFVGKTNLQTVGCEMGWNKCSLRLFSVTKHNIYMSTVLSRIYSIIQQCWGDT